MGNVTSTEKKEETIQWDGVTCPDCHSNRLVSDDTTGDQVCTNCGAVIGDRIVDPGPEWRAFTTEEQSSRARVGLPITLRLHDKGLSTTIDFRDRDIYGRRLSPRVQRQMSRLRRWQKRSTLQTSNERNLIQAFKNLLAYRKTKTEESDIALIDFYTKRALKSEADIEAGRVHTPNEVAERISQRFGK